jgi:Protein of unknown function (DUF1706)
LENSWLDFHESYSGLSDSQMLNSGVTGDWSVRDILAHVTTWEQEALTHLPTILEGGKPPRYSVTHGGINGFNRIMAEQKRNLTLAGVQEALEGTHRRLIRFLETVPENEFRTETPFRHRLRLDTYSHYPKHAEAIRKWRKRLQIEDEKS